MDGLFFCDICFILQDEKNQLMTTNVWLKQVCVNIDENF